MLFQPRTVFILSLLAAVGALGAALIAQFVFGLKPCILCLWQRIPYAVLIGVTLVALLLSSKPKITTPLLVLTSLLFVVSAGLAFFHFGVEQRWWSLQGGCPIQAMSGKSADQMLEELLATPQARCDEVAWRLFGLSITVWNTVFSAAMAIYVGISLFMKRNA
jgi:disulfide bond formation protein DsbB